MPLVQSVGALPQHPVISRALICQFGAILAIVSEPWFSLLASDWLISLQRVSIQRYRAPPAFSVSRALFEYFISISDMVRTRGGSRLRPRVRFSTPEREVPAPAPVPAPSPVPEAVPEEPLGFRRYQTRMGPRAPSPMPQRKVRRARPSKRARISGPGESSSSRPPPSPVTSATKVTSSP